MTTGHVCKRLRPLALGALLALASCDDSATFVYDLGGSSEPAPAAEAPINARCPVGKEEVLANGETVTFRGRAVGFCCDDCAAEFEAMDDAAKADALVAVGVKLPE
jgi:hypothetical protein